MTVLEKLGIKGPWGCKVPANRVQRGLCRTFYREMGPGDSEDWMSGFRPGDKAQTVSSCVGRGSMNSAEPIIQRAIPGALSPGEQLDGDAYYLWVRENDYGDQNPDDGAQVSEGAKGLIEAGILPPDSQAVQIALNQSAIESALKYGPIIQGHIVDNGWNDIDPITGLIPDWIGTAEGGHCTCLLGQWFFPNVDARYPSGNSWGDGWGHKGEFVMTWTRWQKTVIDCWQVRVNPESMAKWRGWEKWVIPRRKREAG